MQNIEFTDLERRISSFASGYTAGAGATDLEIGNAEHVLGVTISGTYRAFLLKFGWIEIGSVELFGVGKDVPEHLNLTKITLSERSEMRPNLNHSLIPVFNDGGGNLYCIDTAVSVLGENPVVFWDHDRNSDQIPDPISPSFADWLFGEIRAEFLRSMIV
jgi:hypothetical protein